MNLNPFENRKNDLSCNELFEKHEGSWGGIKATQFGESYGSYEYLLKGINTNIDWRVTCYTGSYQGELYCLGTLNDKYYFVSTGYGSCSGCDWYQAKEGSIEGLQEIQDELKRSIREFDTDLEFLQYINQDTVSGWYKENLNEFLDEVKKKYNITLSF